MFKVVQRGGVYTGLTKGARGILFSDNGDERLAVEDGKDAKRGDAALSDERGKAGFIERMKDPVADRLSKARKIVQERLRLRAELVLVGLSEVSPVDRGEIGVRMKCREYQAAFRMEHSVPFPQRGKGRRHVRQGQIADKPADRPRPKRKCVHPIRLQPSD